MAHVTIPRMEDVKEPVEERPWYKQKHLVLGTIAAAVLLILGSAAFLVLGQPRKPGPTTNGLEKNTVKIPGLRRAFSKDQMTSPIRNDAPIYFGGVPAVQLLIRLYHAAEHVSSQPLINELEPLMAELCRDTASTGKLKAFMYSLKLEGKSLNPKLFKGTALADIERLLKRAGVVVSTETPQEMNAEHEFQLMLRSDFQLHPSDCVKNGKAIAMISFSTVIGDDVYLERAGMGWVNDGGHLLTEEELERLMHTMILYQYTPASSEEI